MEIRIYIPTNNQPERKYAIKTFLGLFTSMDKVDLQFGDNNTADTTIITIENKKIIIYDALWSADNDECKYISKEYLPIPHISKRIQTLTKENLMILYGKDYIEQSSSMIYCGIDIFAGVFFMLTRWEELLPANLDRHHRFPLIESIAHKYNFVHRPIVNEYIELFKEFLKLLQINNYPYKNRKSMLIPTHDIDSLFYRKTIKAFLGDLLKRKSLKCFVERLFSVYKDPIMIFDFLMDISDKNGLKSRFYFMAAQGEHNDPKNYTDSKRFKNIIASIKNRGHIIGFHPGYSTYNSEDKWMDQYNRLSQKINMKVTEGRQHYLRWDNRITKGFWQKSGMEIDSSLGFAECPGFRCGTGDEFPLFDLYDRKQLSLIERPLILMDTSFSKYGKEVTKKCQESLIKFGKICKKYEMPFTILFHNSNFTKEWKEQKRVYSEFVQSFCSTY